MAIFDWDVIGKYGVPVIVGIAGLLATHFWKIWEKRYDGQQADRRESREDAKFAKSIVDWTEETRQALAFRAQAVIGAFENSKRLCSRVASNLRAGERISEDLIVEMETLPDVEMLIKDFPLPAKPRQD